MLRGKAKLAKHGCFPEEGTSFEYDCPQWRWYTDGTLEGRWEIDDACTAVDLVSRGSLFEALGVRHPADTREQAGLLTGVFSKYDAVGNAAAVALIRTLASSNARNKIRVLGLQMQGVTTVGFLEIAQLLAEPCAFQQLRFIDINYNDFSHGRVI